MSQDLTKAAQRVLRAQAEGRTPSLADHFALGTVGDLDPWFKEGAYPFQNPPREPSVSETTPRTTRPRPSTPPGPRSPEPTQPQPPAAPALPSPSTPPPESAADDDLVPGAPETVLAVRAMLSNPGMKMFEARKIAREAMGYIRRAGRSDDS